MVAEFSDLELHLSTLGHVCGAFVLHILQMNRIRNATRRLKIFRESSGVISFTHTLLIIHFVVVVLIHVFAFN